MESSFSTIERERDHTGISGRRRRRRSVSFADHEQVFRFSDGNMSQFDDEAETSRGLQDSYHHRRHSLLVNYKLPSYLSPAMSLLTRDFGAGRLILADRTKPRVLVDNYQLLSSRLSSSTRRPNPRILELQRQCLARIERAQHSKTYSPLLSFAEQGAALSKRGQNRKESDGAKDARSETSRSKDISCSSEYFDENHSENWHQSRRMTLGGAKTRRKIDAIILDKPMPVYEKRGGSTHELHDSRNIGSNFESITTRRNHGRIPGLYAMCSSTQLKPVFVGSSSESGAGTSKSTHSFHSHFGKPDKIGMDRGANGSAAADFPDQETFTAIHSSRSSKSLLDTPSSKREPSPWIQTVHNSLLSAHDVPAVFQSVSHTLVSLGAEQNKSVEGETQQAPATVEARIMTGESGTFTGTNSGVSHLTSEKHNTGLWTGRRVSSQGKFPFVSGRPGTVTANNDENEVLVAGEQGRANENTSGSSRNRELDINPGGLMVNDIESINTSLSNENEALNEEENGSHTFTLSGSRLQATENRNKRNSLRPFHGTSVDETILAEPRALQSSSERALNELMDVRSSTDSEAGSENDRSPTFDYRFGKQPYSAIPKDQHNQSISHLHSNKRELYHEKSPLSVDPSINFLPQADTISQYSIDVEDNAARDWDRQRNPVEAAALSVEYRDRHSAEKGSFEKPGEISRKCNTTMHNIIDGESTDNTETGPIFQALGATSADQNSERNWAFHVAPAPIGSAPRHPSSDLLPQNEQHVQSETKFVQSEHDRELGNSIIKYEQHSTAYDALEILASMEARLKVAWTMRKIFVGCVTIIMALFFSVSYTVSDVGNSWITQQ